jgi:hypothetical protein
MFAWLPGAISLKEASERCPRHTATSVAASEGANASHVGWPPDPAMLAMAAPRDCKQRRVTSFKKDYPRTYAVSKKCKRIEFIKV